MRVSIPYGTSTLSCDIPDSRLKAVLVSSLHELKADAPEREIVRKSLDNPIGSPRLRDLAKGKENVVIISSDHTRPVPSAIIMPLLLEEVRAGNPDAQITILVSTGGHRATTPEELLKKYGPEIVKNERIVVHDSHDDTSLVHVGTLPSGGDLILNKLAVEADLLVAEGFIEPHFFAGFSGGRKSVLPGVASYTTVMANHCAEFIAHERARTGILEGNPIHIDMVFAARKVGLAFVCNVVIDAEKHIVAAFSGDMEAAHEKGCEFVAKYGRVKAVPADIVITSNAGYPLDQNLYQAVKSMTAGEASCRKGGVIIVAAECSDGHGGEAEGDHGDDHGEGEKSDGAGSVADPDIRQSTDGFYRDHGDLSPQGDGGVSQHAVGPVSGGGLVDGGADSPETGRIGHRHPGRRGSDC